MASPLTYPLSFSLLFVFLFLVLAGSTNSVNLTDGLDGLAIGLTIISAGALTVLAYVAATAKSPRISTSPAFPKRAELTIFCGAMVGASLAFLWYNAHPAEIFMGDVGSLGIGGALGTVAVLIKQEILLLFVGGVFVLEALSVILQVGSYKLRGKRISRWRHCIIISRRWAGRSRRSLRVFGSPAWCGRCWR